MEEEFISGVALVLDQGISKSALSLWVVGVFIFQGLPRGMGGLFFCFQTTGTKEHFGFPVQFYDWFLPVFFQEKASPVEGVEVGAPFGVGGEVFVVDLEEE